MAFLTSKRAFYQTRPPSPVADMTNVGIDLENPFLGEESDLERPL
jgi:hypothetical protein